MAKRTAAAKKRAKERRRRSQSGNRDGDLIGLLPDDILCTIISLLPAKDVARTQAISHRWRHLCRAVPLNLEGVPVLCHDDLKHVSRILADHTGPARRFCFPSVRLGCDYIQDGAGLAEVQRWFRSRALANLEELDIGYDRPRRCPLPSSALRCASTLLVARIGFCTFPSEISPSLSFPVLKQLTLHNVAISEDAFHDVIAGCRALESLVVVEILGVSRFRISSRTLRSIAFRDFLVFGPPGEVQLIIQDAPRLERLLLIHPCGETVRVISAPKLEILGPLSPRHVSKLETASLLQRVTPISLTNSMCTVKVLALWSCGPRLNALLNVLSCFPCLEKLYVIIQNFPDKDTVCQYDPLDQPIKCLRTRLKKVLLENYEGHEQNISLAMFFISNAKVLEEIEFGVSTKCNKKWVADAQHSQLQGASRHVQLKFRNYFPPIGLQYNKHFHDLSMANPFDCLFHRHG